MPITDYYIGCPVLRDICYRQGSIVKRQVEWVEYMYFTCRWNGQSIAIWTLLKLYASFEYIYVLKSCGFFFLRKLKFRHYTRLGIFRSYKRWLRHMTDGLLLTGIHDVVSLWRVDQNDVIIFFSHIIGVNCMKLKARKKIRVFRKLINYLCNTIILYRALLLF